jgi:hypothetical protein
MDLAGNPGLREGALEQEYVIHIVFNEEDIADFS